MLFYKRSTNSQAFTLIELLIVVAIIAILAAIAVPNFLEAQIRAKVSRAKADMRTLATGLEQYAVDYNGFPDLFTRLTSVTTPVQYLSALPQDPFRKQEADATPWRQGRYRYGAMPIDHPSRYAIASVGPDTDIDTYFGGTADSENTSDWAADNQALRFYPGWSEDLISDNGALPEGGSTRIRYIPYDATNGTVSNGDVFRLGDHLTQ